MSRSPLLGKVVQDRIQSVVLEVVVVDLLDFK